MALRIACDLDGTLADMEAALQREAVRLFGPDVALPAGAGAGIALSVRASGGSASADVSTGEAGSPRKNPVATLTGGQLRKLWTHVARVDNFWTSLEEIEPGAVARLASFATQYRWEVIFLTQRPETSGETAQLQSQRWLEAHGFELPSVYVMSGSRGRVASALALDAAIDDSPDNCLDVTVDSNARSFLMWRAGRDVVPVHATRAGITVVFSMAEATEHLRQITPKPDSRQGFVSRARSAIGI